MMRLQKDFREHMLAFCNDLKFKTKYLANILELLRPRTHTFELI